jgi:cytochrome P450
VTDNLGSREAPIEYPVKRTELFAEPELYKTLRAECPVAWATFPNGVVGRLVMRHADVKAITRDRRYSADPHNPEFPQVYKGHSTPELANLSLVGTDPPVHDDERRMISSWFTLKASESYRDDIRRVVDELIDGVVAKGQPGDLIRDFALPLPVWVICLLLGIPTSKRDFIASRTAIRTSYGSTTDDVITATRELQAYIGELMEEKRRKPQDDLGTTIVSHVDEGGLPHQHAVDMFQQLIVAGHETTANAIGLSVVALLDHPDQLEAVLADQALVKPAIEELLRFLSVTHTVAPRVTLEDVEICGHAIEAGTGLRALIHSANYDDAVFADPDKLDIRRDAREHLAFGFGIHNCLGQSYARIEMQEAIWQLFTRLPGLRVAVPRDDLHVKWEAGIHGLYSLPVAWS